MFGLNMRIFKLIYNQQMKAKINFDKKIAKKFHDIRYYKSNEFLAKNLETMEKEKKEITTINKDKVTKKIKSIINNRENKDARIYQILEKIYEKNQDYAFKKTKEKPVNSDLLNLVADISLLMTSYSKIRKNKGAMTEAAEMSEEKYKNFNAEDKSWANKIADSPDAINRNVFILTSKLIKTNKYPWGSSRRIYVDKPGKKDVKRPITIPPFMDKVVQENIIAILTAIYEPYFESLNCSFGFRPNKGVHDAMVALTNMKTNGLYMALEGDIKSAYDKVDRRILLKILEEKVHDKKFLQFIEKRLDYDFYDTQEKKYIRLKEGLPQGGIDSPYMWNIYMSVFDSFVITNINEQLEEYNEKVRGKLSKRKIVPPERRKIERKKTTVKKIILWIEDSIKKNINPNDLIKEMNKGSTYLKKLNILAGELHNFKEVCEEIKTKTAENLVEIRSNAIKLYKNINKEALNLQSQDQNKLRLRCAYVRYADDWILLTNAKKHILEKIKEKIAYFLMEKLKAQLAMEKTLITDTRENPARFLGYELWSYKNKKIGKYKQKNKKHFVTATTAGSKIFAKTDRQRLIDRLYMKGYCTIDGSPKEMGFISNLEDFSIIERFNSVLMGIALYYTEFIRNPRRNLSQWIYIIRFSCIKTIAQKHKLSVAKVFKKYSSEINKEDKSRERTIEVRVINQIEEKKYEKIWKLLTTGELIQKAISLKRRKELFDIYWKLEKGTPIIYVGKEKRAITNDNFYEKLMWINIRTQSSFDLPCSICGSEEDIEMHHIKHVRKNRYDLIDKNESWSKAMYLRNRKQIPVCRECHINIIHKGKYGGMSLNTITPRIMYDNRIITIESHINKRAINKEKPENYTKTLEEKGWKCI